MKKIIVLILLVLSLAGCSRSSDDTISIKDNAKSATTDRLGYAQADRAALN